MFLTRIIADELCRRMNLSYLPRREESRLPLSNAGKSYSGPEQQHSITANCEVSILNSCRFLKAATSNRLLATEYPFHMRETSETILHPLTRDRVVTCPLEFSKHGVPSSDNSESLPSVHVMALVFS